MLDVDLVQDQWELSLTLAPTDIPEGATDRRYIGSFGSFVDEWTGSLSVNPKYTYDGVSIVPAWASVGFHETAFSYTFGGETIVLTGNYTVHAPIAALSVPEVSNSAALLGASLAGIILYRRLGTGYRTAGC